MITGVRITISKLKSVVEKDLQAGKLAVQQATGEIADELKLDLRSQLARRGFSKRLQNTWRSSKFPRKPSLGSAATVWSEADRIMQSLEYAPTIRAKSGRVLAIPTEVLKGRRLGRYRVTPERLKQAGVKLEYVPPARGRKVGFLVSTDYRYTSKGGIKLRPSNEKKTAAKIPVALFFLVPTAKMKKGLSFFPKANGLHSKLPGLVVEKWEANSARSRA